MVVLAVLLLRDIIYCSQKAALSCCLYKIDSKRFGGTAVCQKTRDGSENAVACVCVWEAGDWRIMKDGREANDKILVRQKEREQTEKKRLISRGEKGKRKGPNLQTTKRKIKEQFPFFFSSRMVDEESPQPRFIVQPEGRVYTVVQCFFLS